MKTYTIILLFFFLNYSISSKDPSTKKNSNFLINGPEDVFVDDKSNPSDENSKSKNLSNNFKETKNSQIPKTPGGDFEQIYQTNDEKVLESKNNEIQTLIDKIQKLELRPNNSSIREITKILIKHQYPEVRAEAARALGRMKTGLKALHRTIETDTLEVKQEAYRAIEKIGSRSSLKYFKNGISSSDHEVQSASFIGLGKTKSSIGRDLILKYGITAENTSIISSALIGLGYYSKKDDLDIFHKFLQSEFTEIRKGAITGLGNSKQISSVYLLLASHNANPDLDPEIIISLSKKDNLPSTYALIKLLHLIKNENYQNLILKELFKRKAFGKYAIVKHKSASVRKHPKPNSPRVILLNEGDVAKIKSITEKFFKAKMNDQILEDKYYLLQTINRNESSKKLILEGWVFGPKITVISLTDPNYKKQSKGNNKFLTNDENSEDEKTFVNQSNSESNIELKKLPINEKPFQNKKLDIELSEDDDE
jgi:hypothetical protein